MSARIRLPLFALFIWIAAATGLLAFHPVDELARWEIPRLGAPSQRVWQTYRVGRVHGMAPTPVETFADRHGGTWHYQMNQSTGTYHHIYGTGIDVGRPIDTKQAAEDLAREFILAHQSLFAVTADDLAVVSSAHGLGKWSVIFEQTHQGIRVWGGRVHLVFTDKGRLFEMGSDAYPGIDVSPVPAVDEDEALAIAKSSIGFKENRDRVDRTELLVLPVELSEGGLEYRLAYRIDLRVDRPLGIWATYVDANTGEILWRENRMRFSDYTGHVQGDVEWDSYCDGYTEDYPLKNMSISISNVGQTLTDENGDFSLTDGGGPETIYAEFRGPWVDVDRITGGDASHSGTIEPGVPYTIDWTVPGVLDAERDVFAGVNKQHDWLKIIDPGYTGVDYEMPAVIERTDYYCPGNAWWDGYSINFCDDGGGYGNTGRMEDVVYHEYGHGITDFLYGPNDPPSDIHEANSDWVANILTRESIIGLGFYLDECTSGIRNSKNTIQYPCDGGGHYCGQVLAGFHWDAWEQLLALYPQDYADSVISYTWHYGRKLGLPQNQPDQVYWTFVADDDDGNLDNGTPHHAEFCVGAANHGFTCPEIVAGVFITHTPLEDTTVTVTPYEVKALIVSSDGSVIVDSCRVTYRVNGGEFADVPMAPTGELDEYVGYVPPQSTCSKVEYYIYAADDVGYTKSHPVNAPDFMHIFVVGYGIAFEDDFETDQGWTAGMPGDGAETGMWERCDPESTEAQPEDDNTPDPGTDAYITQCDAGISQGTWDVDEGRTTLQSPILDLSEYDRAAVSYYRWYSNNTGANPGQDYWIVKVSDDGWVTSAVLESTKVSDRSWSRTKFDVGAYVDFTSTVQFRFIATDDAPGSIVEAGVDDFLLLACTSLTDTLPPQVTLLDPNGGEVIVGGGGSTYEIRWVSDDDVGVSLTSILMSTDGGATYPDTLTSGTLDSTFLWSVPDLDETACRVKVVCRDDAGKEGSDESDSDFEIRSISGASGPGLSAPGDVPTRVILLQSKPSPFAASTEIRFGLPRSQRVSLKVYGVDGRLVATMVDGIYAEGYHLIVWQGTDHEGKPVSPGMYFYRLTTDEGTLTRKLIRVK